MLISKIAISERLKSAIRWDLTEEERETLVTMAAGQKPKKRAYYAKALAQIEKGELGLWNWPAALLSGTWMHYHKMFRVFNLLMIPSCVVLGVWLGWSGVDITALSREEPVSNLGKAFILLRLGCMALMGTFGNRLLFWALRRKLKQGYLKLPYYKTTESWWLWVWYGSPLCVVFVLLLAEMVILAFALEAVGAELSIAIGGVAVALARVGGRLVIFWKALVEPIRDSSWARRLAKPLEK